MKQKVGSVKEEFGEYRYTEFDPDPDSDFDRIYAYFAKAGGIQSQGV